MKKKVICLYRVSTKKQVNKEADIPIQRETCREYIKRHNQQYDDEWEFFMEILEGGVSAYHKDVEEREIQQVIQIASAHPEEKFVLLAFYSDRISRQDINGMTFIDKLYRLGVEVWTVQEGRLKMDSESDRLMMFIKFWGNNNESRKTANRVYAARKVLTEAGVWTGGTVPYGYSLEQTGEVSKKGRVINDLVKEPKESVVVKEIYDKLIYENFTLNGIMEELNTRGLRTKKGCKWNTSTIKNIIKNPIYKGFIGYNKTSQQGGNRQKATDRSQWVLAKEKNLNYVIVSESEWEMAQDILERKSRSYHANLRASTDKTYKSQLLLAGLLVCGCCGTSISPAVSSQWTSEKKEKKTYIEYYRCNLRAKGAKQCKSKSYISAKKLEKAVMEQIYSYLDSLQEIDCTAEIERMITEETSEDTGKLRQLSKAYEKAHEKKKALEEEMIKSIMGDSALSKENINTAIDNQVMEIKRLEGEIEETEKIIKAKNLSMKEMTELQELIPIWRDVFDFASLNVKKHLLSLLIEKIVITGNNVDIYFRITAEQFWDKVKLHQVISSYQEENGNKREEDIALDEEDGSDQDHKANRESREKGEEKYISFYKDGRSNLAHHVVSQMLTLKSITAGDTKIIKIVIRVIFGNWRKCL